MRRFDRYIGRESPIAIITIMNEPTKVKDLSADFRPYCQDGIVLVSLRLRLLRFADGILKSLWKSAPFVQTT